MLPLLLAVSTINELRDGLANTRQTAGSAVLLESILQLVSGALSVGALVAMWIRRELVFRLLVLWGATITAVAGLAPVVYGGESAGIGVMAGVSTAVVVGLVAWVWHRHGAPPHETT